MSSSGYIGLVPSTSIIGDRVCLLAGGRTPYVLRHSRKKTGEDVSNSPEYTFVGGVYVHGLMDGETLDMMEKGSLQMLKTPNFEIGTDTFCFPWIQMIWKRSNTPKAI